MTISDPIYGQIEITEPVLVEIIETPAMQRLKGVDQNVTANLLPVPWKPFSRFDHCIGVMHLIHTLGGDVEEQIAGLTHDISHTAFSHVMDFVFDQEMTQGFHEQHLESIMNKSGIPPILQKYHFNLDRIINHHNFSILEQEIPALCADRVDYAVKTFYSVGMDVGEAGEFLKYLALESHRIVFTKAGPAEKFAKEFMKSDLEVWGGSARCNLAYHLFASVVKNAYTRGEVKLENFFSTDMQFLDKLGADSRRKIEELKHLAFLEVKATDAHDFHLNGKIRYVDPLVQTAEGTRKLAEISPGFASDLQQFLARRKQGNYVKIL